MAEKAKVKCETCRFWVQGDLSARRIRNSGQCTFMMVQTDGFYYHNPRVPFWVKALSARTISYNGSKCPTWEKRT